VHRHTVAYLHIASFDSWLWNSNTHRNRSVILLASKIRLSVRPNIELQCGVFLPRDANHAMLPRIGLCCRHVTVCLFVRRSQPVEMAEQNKNNATQ